MCTHTHTSPSANGEILFPVSSRDTPFALFFSLMSLSLSFSLFTTRFARARHPV